MSNFDIDDLTGPFLKAFQGEIGMDEAVEIAAYNMMLTYIQDQMIRMASKSAFANFFFTGFIGSIFTFFLSHLLSFIASEGGNFAVSVIHEWHVGKLKDAYIANMTVWNNEIDLKEVLTEADKDAYKTGVKNELKKFFNLARYLKP